ncbi:Gpi-anchored protein [Thalictrum thalictroides]|uniref:Gpi-anchored protein n=1 Tax=Thalictrum thalictroides TaxID=46969 RepID=A0A7J6XBY1_THATH|nr:Gpi-anchored protein [Thalictrum thalictroides]
MRSTTHATRPFCNSFLLFIIWLSAYQQVKAVHKPLQPNHTSTLTFASPPTTGLFDPIQISPSVIPHYPYPEEPLSPMYPSFPTTYEPVLTGNCPINFSAISTLIDKTSSDCSAPLAALVGNVICCPQVNSLLHIFQAHYTSNSTQLVLQNVTASDCFSDIISILASRGANITIPKLCSVNSSNLTGGICPVTDANIFEKTVNTSKLLEACTSVDPLKECCRPVCQPAILDAALHISLRESTFGDSNIVKEPTTTDVLTDCKGVVYSWLSRKLSPDAANTAFRILSACKVNKVCPLEFNKPSEVIKACRDLAAPNPCCCSSLNTYIVRIQKEMLITNRQAINCATLFGSMLQKGGVMTDIYELCDVDLKDFSLQAYGQQGCLLRSLPSDVVVDNTTGYSFTCDLSDNVAAPWPSSSSVSSLSLCAPEMSLPALPTLEASANPGYHHNGYKVLVPIFSFSLLSLL